MKRKSLPVVVACYLLIFWGCKGKETETQKEPFISAKSIITEQVKHIDTSLYSIIKVTYKDSTHSDTEYIKREEVRLFAKDFLELPEISKKKFTEENIPGSDNTLPTISYTPIDPDKEEIQRLYFMIDPGLADKGKSVIKTIYIDRSFTNRDSAVQKILLWQMDKSFQVTTIRQLPGQPETTSTYKVIWNEEDDQ
jgi:hypothetical protein